ncbi:MAG: patatin family protein [Clostridia bacterium]|nr:patatin family protein [Clostridia bacterium]
MKLGVVDVGGGMRGIYAAGVLDYCLEANIKFDCCVGVSAGSANLITYLAGQKERNFKFYHEYSFRKKYMGLGNFLFSGSYFNLNYIYGTLGNSDGENPLDYAAYKKNPADFFVVAEDAVSGNPVYFTRNNIKKDDCRVLMASSSIPGINKPFDINGRLYFDGALADPVPIQKAFLEGCDRVVLLLSKPMDEPFDYQTDVFLANLIKNQYPLSANRLMLRAEKYERSIALANQYASMNRLLFIAPEQTFGVTATKRTKKGLESLYSLGKADGEKISEWLKN